jgi:hypothetical protein
MMQQRYCRERGDATNQRREHDQSQIVLIHNAIINRQHEIPRAPVLAAARYILTPHQNINDAA